MRTHRAIIAGVTLTVCISCARRPTHSLSPEQHDVNLLKIGLANYAAKNAGKLPENWDEFGPVMFQLRDAQAVSAPLDGRYVFAGVRWPLPDFDQEGLVILLGNVPAAETQKRAPGRYAVVQLDNGQFEREWLPEANVQSLLEKLRARKRRESFLDSREQGAEMGAEMGMNIGDHERYGATKSSSVRPGAQR